jgi:hypothetical protein
LSSQFIAPDAQGGFLGRRLECHRDHRRLRLQHEDPRHAPAVALT